jgi:hypothetical protein
MVTEKKRKGSSRKDTESGRNVDVKVNLAAPVEFLHKYVTESLCNEVFQDVRTTERQRKWSLYALARFWIGVVVEAPPSLSQQLEIARRGDPRGLLPEVDASAEAFFQKCKQLDSGFFMALYARFINQVVEKAPKKFCSIC